MVDPYTYRSTWVACAGNMKVKYERENRRRLNKCQIEGSNTNDIFQRFIVWAQNTERMHGQVTVAKAPKKMQEEYLKFHFIPYL